LFSVLLGSLLLFELTFFVFIIMATRVAFSVADGHLYWSIFNPSDKNLKQHSYPSSNKISYLFPAIEKFELDDAMRCFFFFFFYFWMRCQIPNMKAPFVEILVWLEINSMCSGVSGKVSISSNPFYHFLFIYFFSTQVYYYQDSLFVTIRNSCL